MSKAEELKQKAKHPHGELYIFVGKELDEYVNEVSRKNMHTAWKEGAAYGDSRSDKNWNDFWNLWIKEQKEQ